MTTIDKNRQAKTGKLPLWLSALLPLIALALMLSIFAFGNPLAMFAAELPPVEVLSFEPIRVTPDGFEVPVVNGGPDPITVAQVLVDEAYWQFAAVPSATIPRFGRATLFIPYPWVETEPHEILLITSTGLTFTAEVELATLTPTPGLSEFLAYALLGVYVGIIPVGLGMLWYPAMKALGRQWIGAALALTIGLLFFLFIDTLTEVFEVAEGLPGFLQGVPMALFAAVLTWLVLVAVGSRRRPSAAVDPARRRLYLAALIALGIGLHNLGEGLAIGAAFALGEAALGSFLVIGFTLHNITEGIGIAAPLIPASDQEQGGADAQPAGPRLRTFIWLTLLAGAPAILGAWVGGFAFLPVLATLFLGIGLGAIWQVIVEVGSLLRNFANQEDAPLVSWINLAGFLAGLLIMYLTAFLVEF